MTTPAPETTQDARGLGRWGAGLLVALFVALGFWLRLDELAATPLYGDEYHGARIAKRTFANLFRFYDPYGTHVPLPMIQRVFALLFEPGILTFRLPAVLAGLLTLLLFYPLSRPILGRSAALVSTAALALSPVHVYYSRFGRAYAITILLGLVLLALLHRADRERWRGRGRTVAIVVTAALLPYTHLSSAGLVLALGLAAIGLAWARDGARAARKPLIAFVVAALVCALLFVPILEQVIEYATKHPEQRKDRPDGPIGISVILAGGGIAGIAWMVGIPLSIALLFRRDRASAVLIGASILGPLVFLVSMLPHGMEYAYARYLVNAVPGMVMLMAWLVVRAFGRRELVGVAAGLALVAAVHLTGPLSPLRGDQGTFRNTYQAMRELPAFDRPFKFTPKVYEEIANDAEAQAIIEWPTLHTRAVLLMRNYQLQHGKRVVMGLSSAPDDVRLNGPYVFVGGPLVERSTGARYLVVHKDILVELEGYWRWVYDRAWPKVESLWDRGFMDRHRTYFVPEVDPRGMAAALLPPLRQRLGEPFYEDPLVAVWKLRKGRGD